MLHIQRDIPVTLLTVLTKLLLLFVMSALSVRALQCSVFSFLSTVQLTAYLPKFYHMPQKYLLIW